MSPKSNNQNVENLKSRSTIMNTKPTRKVNDVPPTMKTQKESLPAGSSGINTKDRTKSNAQKNAKAPKNLNANKKNVSKNGKGVAQKNTQITAVKKRGQDAKLKEPRYKRPQFVPKVYYVDDRTVQRWYSGQRDSRLLQKRLHDWKYMKQALRRSWARLEEERSKITEKMSRVNEFLHAMKAVKGKEWVETSGTGQITYDPDGTLVAWYEIFEERQRLGAERLEFEITERRHTREVQSLKAFVIEERLTLQKEKEIVAAQKKRNENERRKNENLAKALKVKEGHMDNAAKAKAQLEVAEMLRDIATQRQNVEADTKAIQRDLEKLHFDQRELAQKEAKLQDRKIADVENSTFEGTGTAFETEKRESATLNNEINPSSRRRA